MARQQFTTQIIELIRSVPRGYVSTYGDIARMAGTPQAARQVARILHTCATPEKLPWHRIVNREGRISLKPFQGYEEQKMLLENEGVVFDKTGKINLDQYRWNIQPEGW